MATACTQGKRTQHGKPQCVIRDDQPDAREGQAGRAGVAERLVVPRKPGNAGGGKGPQFKTNAISGEGPGDWATYQLRNVFRNCRWRYTRKRRQKSAIASTPCTTRSAVKIFWRTPMPSAAPIRARRARIGCFFVPRPWPFLPGQVRNRYGPSHRPAQGRAAFLARQFGSRSSCFDRASTDVPLTRLNRRRVTGNSSSSPADPAGTSGNGWSRETMLASRR